MPRAARFPEDTRHFMVRNVGISPLPNSVKIDEIECHAILCERNLAQKLALRASQADHGQVIWALGYIWCVPLLGGSGSLVVGCTQ